MTNLNDLQQVREFVQIADSGSISAAAKILGMAQPTLSRHLAALETQIGAPLIRRDTHTMSVTEAGRILLADARELLALADRLGKRLHGERRELRGHLRIVSVVDVGQWIVSRVLSRFRKLHPQVTMELHLINRPTKFVKEGFDCGVMVGGPTDRRVTTKKVAELNRRLVAAPSLLAEHAAPQRPADLSRLPWLGILQPHFYARDRVDLVRKGKVVKLKFAPVMLLDTVTALREAVIEGAGFTSVPEWMASRDIAAGRLVQLLPDWHIEPVDLHLAHASHEQLPERVRTLLEYLAAGIPEEIHKLDLGDR
ncbi:MAG: LysR family transcriptional regulator [Prosthecobacter sp.]|jgi:DNA-binding transcriptional LysR family regulator|uniref:LysR family transcriptional regulator n=1 Tax=Prosthecobacter sp. TaxID=1965333 RepID=UPI001A08AFDD|nr:LysR family transcriptional regulator [Prosthecobacter sp.]MBE2284038.1 LysR family transcriptional regulator [Prosthecobacter sp.]